MMRDIKFRAWDDNLASQGFLSDDVHDNQIIGNIHNDERLLE